MGIPLESTHFSLCICTNLLISFAAIQTCPHSLPFYAFESNNKKKKVNIKIY